MVVLVWCRGGLWFGVSAGDEANVEVIKGYLDRDRSLPVGCFGGEVLEEQKVASAKSWRRVSRLKRVMCAGW